MTINQILAELAHGLARLSISYAVMGGQAVLLHGEPRMTRDIDLTLGVDTTRLPDLLRLAEESGWRVLVANPEEFVTRHLVLPCEDAGSGVRLDLIFGLSPFERGAIARAQAVEIEGAPVRFVTVEDLLIMKLVAGRPRDLEDARGLVRKHPGFERAYVLGWLEQYDRDLGLETVAHLRGMTVRGSAGA